MRTTAQTTTITNAAVLRSAWWADGRLLLVILLSCLVGVLAYGAPPSGSVPIGWLGDRLFLAADEGLGNSTSLYADDLTPDSPTQRSRWTRQDATITLPSLGAGVALDVALVAQGWPADIVGRPPMQPTVTVYADGVEVGTLQPQSTWETYHVSIPAAQRTHGDLMLRLHTSDTFTDTVRGADSRPKGVRLARITIQSLANTQSFALLPPAWPMVAQMVLVALLSYGLFIRLFGNRTVSFVLGLFAAGIIGMALAAARVWTAAILGANLLGSSGGLASVVLTPLVLLLAIVLVGTWRRDLLRLVRALVLRYAGGRGLGYGLVVAALAWLCYALARWSQSAQLPGTSLFVTMFPDSLLYGLLGMGLLALAFVRGREGLPRLANSIVAFLEDRWAAPIMLVLFGGVWLGYEALVVGRLGYVGHADYADNAVVARNLLAGRGWVVDYVTQFYHLYPSLTHPQETWPLLQPVWIALSFAVFGVSSWAAKVPNLIFNGILLVLVYRIGARVWDRRVGLTAAVLLLTNWLFFRLTIYATSDLGFVVLSLGAVYALYCYRTAGDRETGRQGDRETGRQGDANQASSIKHQASSIKHQASNQASGIRHRVSLLASPLDWLIVSGILTGLMILQKPSSGIMAAGMGLWLLLYRRKTKDEGRKPMGYRSSFVFRPSSFVHLLLWGALAAVVISPYVVRNLVLWGTPAHSTEGYDAWVLSYRGDTPEAWDDIYRIYDPSLGGAGLPDRSWVLRWGFDQTFDKFERQIAAVRDYLLPPWSGLPDGLANLAARADKQQLLFGLGAWLALAGLIAAIRFRRRLIALLALTFTPYVIFLATYWHTTEERYFVQMLPWLALLAAWTIWACYRKLAAIGDGRWAPLGLVLALAVIVGVVQPSWPDIASKVQDEPALWQPDLAAYDWIKANTPPGAAMMTRTPWQLNWHTDHPALMIPNNPDRNLLLQLAHHYGVQYLVLETIHRPKGDARSAVESLMTARTAQPGAVIDGFELVYASPTPDNRVLIYRLPQ